VGIPDQLDLAAQVPERGEHLLRLVDRDPAVTLGMLDEQRGPDAAGVVDGGAREILETMKL
jgi:hypothetical protein